MIMPSLNSGEYYCEVIKPEERKSIVSRRKFLLDLRRPMTDEESRNNGIYVFKFDEDDIVRSGLVKFILKKLKNVG